MSPGSSSFHPEPLSLSLSLNLLLGHDLHALHILIRRWSVLLISIKALIRSLTLRATELHPEVHNRLSNQHTHSGSGHAECHTDKDGDEDNFDRSPKYPSHTAKESLVMVMMVKLMAACGLEVDMAGELHSTIGAAVGDATVMFLTAVFLTALVVRVGVFVALVEFMAGDFVEAFDAEALHLVCARLGCGLGFFHPC